MDLDKELELCAGTFAELSSHLSKVPEDEKGKRLLLGGCLFRMMTLMDEVKRRSPDIAAGAVLAFEMKRIANMPPRYKAGLQSVPKAQ